MDVPEYIMSCPSTRSGKKMRVCYHNLLLSNNLRVTKQRIYIFFYLRTSPISLIPFNHDFQNRIRSSTLYSQWSPRRNRSTSSPSGQSTSPFTIMTLRHEHSWQKRSVWQWQLKVSSRLSITASPRRISRDRSTSATISSSIRHRKRKYVSRPQ